MIKLVFSLIALYLVFPCVIAQKTDEIIKKAQVTFKSGETMKIKANEFNIEGELFTFSMRDPDTKTRLSYQYELSKIDEIRVSNSETNSNRIYGGFVIGTAVGLPVMFITKNLVKKERSQSYHSPYPGGAHYSSTITDRELTDFQKVGIVCLSSLAGTIIGSLHKEWVILYPKKSTMENSKKMSFRLGFNAGINPGINLRF